MMGDTYDVDGESIDERVCDDCGREYAEPAALKADGGTCPDCSGGVIG